MKALSTVVCATWVIVAVVAGVIVTTSPVLRVAVPVAAPSAIVTLYVSFPYVTSYSYLVCALPSYVHSPSDDLTLNVFVLFEIVNVPSTYVMS